MLELCCLTAVTIGLACGSGQGGSQDVEPVVLSGYNLQGDWRWYDRFEQPTGCPVRMFVDGERWNGWIVQDFEVTQQCTRVGASLDRADIDGGRITLWFRDAERSSRYRMRLELEVVGPTVLQSRTTRPPYTLVRIRG